MTNLTNFNLNHQKILVTGGTGSFGNAFVSATLKKYPNVEIVIYSRDEMKQWEMALKYNRENRIKFPFWTNKI